MKLLATDLDGTLFYPKEKKNLIDSENLKVVRDFIDSGNEVAIVSGRSLEFCKIVEKKINRPVTAICFNGALVAKGNEILVSKTIPNSFAKKVINDFFDTFSLLGAFIMTDKGVFIHLRTKNKIVRYFAEKYYKMQRKLAETYSFDEKLYEEELEKGRIYKVMFFFGITKKAKLRASEANKILRNSTKDYEFSWSGMVIEITAKDCYKSNAILNYIHQENIKHEDVIVVGDSGNDISNFKEFHENSYCMGHASKIVQNYAKVVINKFSDLTRYIF